MANKNRKKSATAEPEVQSRSSFKWLAISLPLVAVLLIDLAIRLVGWLPPDDPLLFYLRSYEEGFLPFVEQGDQLKVREDWVNSGDTVQHLEGSEEGRFFLLPGFRPRSFDRVKEPGTLRIFALGGSTTFSLGVGAEKGFPGLLEQALATRFADRKVELINLGCAGWASGRVAKLLPKLLDFSPDLILVYSGHNEMLRGHFGSKPQVERRDAWSAKILRTSSIVAWLHHGTSRFRDPQRFAQVEEENAAAAAGRISLFDPMSLPPQQRRLPSADLFADAEAQYRTNLRSMIEAARDASVPTLFILPAANLLIPPAFSAHSEGVDSAAVEQLLERARTATMEAGPEEGLRLMDEAVALSPSFAMTYFWRGTLLEGMGQLQSAREQFQHAVDLDVRTHRITSGLETAFIDTMASTGTPWVDLRPVFHSRLDQPWAQQLFVDFCHPSAFGHRLIAEQAFAPMLAALAVEGASSEGASSEGTSPEGASSAGVEAP